MDPLLLVSSERKNPNVFGGLRQRGPQGVIHEKSLRIDDLVPSSRHHRHLKMLVGPRRLPIYRMFLGDLSTKLLGARPKRDVEVQELNEYLGMNPALYLKTLARDSESSIIWMPKEDADPHNWISIAGLFGLKFVEHLSAVVDLMDSHMSKDGYLSEASILWCLVVGESAPFFPVRASEMARPSHTYVAFDRNEARRLVRISISTS